MSATMTPELSARAVAALDAEKAKATKKYKITIDRLMAKLNEELEAEETKVFNDKESGIVYSDPLVAWKIRQEARRDAEAHLGIKPAEKQEVEHKGNFIFEIVDYGDGKSKAKRKGGNGSKN
jgi:hypothetical protein